MDKETSMKAVVAVCLVLTLVSIGMSAYVIATDDDDQGPDDARYFLYFGMGDRTDEQIETIEDAIIQEIFDHGYGYNLDRGCGGYQIDGKEYQDRVSLKFTVTFATHEDIMDIVDTIKGEYGFNAVFTEADHVYAGSI